VKKFIKYSKGIMRIDKIVSIDKHFEAHAIDPYYINIVFENNLVCVSYSIEEERQCEDDYKKIIEALK